VGPGERCGESEADMTPRVSSPPLDVKVEAERGLSSPPLDVIVEAERNGRKRSLSLFLSTLSATARVYSIKSINTLALDMSVFFPLVSTIILEFIL
jgi:hypothetical protein